ncbi:MAG: hypothetical protein WBK55_00030 [Alphaproteobacteria bacterium]
MTSHRPVSNRIQLTKAKLALLRSHVRRTGVSIPALLKMHEKETRGITYKITYDWLTGRAKTAGARHFKTLIKIYETLPDKNEFFTEVSEETLLDLRKEINRSGITARNIFVRAENIPEGLTVFHVENLVRGLLKKTRREYMEFVLSEWKKQADTTTIRITITPEMFAHMLKEKERTGFGPMALLHGTKKERPQGLTTSLMDSWLAGRTKSARKDHLDYVFRRWEEMLGSMKES